MYGLSSGLIAQIAEAAQQLGAEKLVLFGSRARGTHRASSDIDLAVYGLEPQKTLALKNALEELETLLKFDLIPVCAGTDRLLLAEIDKDGVVLMERRVTKLDQFEMALGRLREAMEEYRATQSRVVRDGVIQRFEFTCELAWKSCRERLLEEGFTGIDSPKAAMRQAFSFGLIDDEQGWLNLLQARNLTSHMYSDQQVQDIYVSIENVFEKLFDRLLKKLKE